MKRKKQIRHRWAWPFYGLGVQECIHCGSTRESIIIAGYPLQLRSYVRTDGIRFTGRAPECDRSMKHLSRPILLHFEQKRSLLQSIFGPDITDMLGANQ